LRFESSRLSSLLYGSRDILFINAGGFEKLSVFKELGGVDVVDTSLGCCCCEYVGKVRDDVGFRGDGEGLNKSQTDIVMISFRISISITPNGNF